MADIDIELEVQAKKAKQELEKINKELNDTGKGAKKAGRSIESSFNVSAGAIAGATAAIAAFGAGFAFAINEASKLQDLETQFIAFTGSAEGAANQVERIAEFSGETPFQLEELVTANRTLLAFGQSTEESLVTLKQLGDVSAGTGADLGELALILGQVEAAGKLTGERFLQFAERGINLAPILAKQLGVAESEIANLRSQGKITADDVSRAFEAMTSEGGKFEGSMDRLSRTFSGATSTLRDNISLLFADFGKKLIPAFTETTITITENIKAFRAWLNETDPEKIRQLEISLADAKAELDDINDSIEKGNKLEGLTGYRFGADTLEDYRIAKERVAQITAEIEKLRAKNESISNVEGGGAQPTDDSSPLLDPSVISEAQKIDQKLIELSEQYYANRNARAKSQNEEEIAILDERFVKIQEKLVEQQSNRLQVLGEFDEAEKLQVQAKLDAIEQAEKAQLDRRKANAEQARKDELNLEKRTADARLKFQEQTWEERARTAQTGLAALASIQSTGSREAFEIGKAASIAQALVSIPSTAIKAYESLAGIPIVGPGLGAAAAAAAIAAGTARVNQIKSTKFRAFAEGGLVEGGTPGRDSVPSLLTPGEVVVPQKSFRDLRFNNEEQVFETRAVRSTLDETNGILRQIATQQSFTESLAREEFREQKFSSTTPGGIFYEPVDDSFEPEIEIIEKARVGVRVDQGRGFQRQQIARR